MVDVLKQAQIQYSDNDKQVDIRYQFIIVDSEEFEMNSPVTEYIVEDGSMRQEHVVLNPIEFTIEGYVAEKVYEIQQQVVGSLLLQQISKLQPIAALLPEVSSYAQTAIAATNYVERNIRQVINKVKNLNKWMTTQLTKTKMQKKVADEFKILRNNRTLVTVTSDFGVFNNMHIESVKMTQEDTYDQCKLIVKLKQYNNVETQLTTINKQNYLGRLQQQAAVEQDLGRIQGQTMSTLRSWVSPTIVPYLTGVDQ